VSLAGGCVSAFVRGYQLLLRPLLPPACRFEPSCSEYYRQALESHGALRATGLAIRRLGRCHPWHEGGYDPPPLPNGLHRDKPGV
jgi:putative membrane protein insertion efficiency factor